MTFTVDISKWEGGSGELRVMGMCVNDVWQTVDFLEVVEQMEEARHRPSRNLADWAQDLADWAHNLADRAQNLADWAQHLADWAQDLPIHLPPVDASLMVGT